MVLRFPSQSCVRQKPGEVGASASVSEERTSHHMGLQSRGIEAKKLGVSKKADNRKEKKNRNVTTRTA